MREGITIEFSPALMALIRQTPKPVVEAAIARALDRENEYTVGATVRERLSFPRGAQSTTEGLRVQTGRLRRSLSRSRAVVMGGAVVSAIGSNVRYFGPHEFGFDGLQSVPAHERRLPDRYFLSTGQTVSAADARRAGLTTRRGDLRKGLGEKAPTRYVTVRAHQRRMRLPARQMVRRTLADRMPLYLLAIREEIVRSVSGPN